MKKLPYSILIASFLSLLLCLSCFFYALPLYRPKQEEKKEVCIRLWHVDTFEGGVGSRGQFLKGIAREFTKKNGGIILLSTHTKEGVEEEFAKGNYPDVLSFGVGVFPPVESCKKQKDGGLFSVWCKGGYALYAKTEDFSLINEKNTVISIGGENLATLPALFLGIGGAKREDSISAYVHFLQGKYTYLLGTQRDYFRFQKRGESVHFSPLYSYLDLSQYLCILSQTEIEYAKDLVEYILSPKVQRKLDAIGMFSQRYPLQGGELAPFQQKAAEYTLSPYISKEGFRKLNEAVESGNLELSKKFLKHI